MKKKLNNYQKRETREKKFEQRSHTKSDKYRIKKTIEIPIVL